jgi:hypothetical protein
MAGFTLQRREIVIRFAEDTNLHGLEVTAKLDIPLSLFLEFQTAVSGDPNLEETQTAGIQNGMHLFASEILLDWNLEDDDGKRIKPSVETFFELSPQVCTEIVQEWSAAVSSPDPLPSTTSSSSSLSEPVKEELMVLSHGNPQS